MMKMVVRMHPDVSREALSEVLGIDGLEIAWSSRPRALWLRGEVVDPKDRQAIRLLPACGVFQCDDGGGALIPWGRRLPVGRLPSDLEWRALAGWLSVGFSPAAMGGQLVAEEHRAPLDLVRVREAFPQPANLCLTSVAALHRYVDQAAGARFAGLRFAAAGDGRALVLGEPLLPLPGRRYRLTEGLAFPLGWGLSLPLRGETVRRCLGLAAAEIAVVHEDKSYDRLREDDLLQVSRSAVRFTFERLQMQGAMDGNDHDDGGEEVAS